MKPYIYQKRMVEIDVLIFNDIFLVFLEMNEIPKYNRLGFLYK